MQGEKYTRCHDFCLCYEGNGYHLICIADGVGENTYCQIGSQLACESLRDFVEKGVSYKAFSKDQKSVYIMLLEGFQYAVRQIEEKAEEHNHNVEEYGTTLSAIYITDDYAVWGHSGDGAIFSVTEDGIIEKLTTEKSGTASGEVYPLLSGAAWWSFGITESAYAFMLMTDGVFDYFQRLHQREDLASFYRDFFMEIQKENKESYIEKLVFSDAFKQCTRDDRTLAVALDEHKNIPVAYYYHNEPSIKRPNLFAEIFVKQLSEVNEGIFTEQINESEIVFRHVEVRDQLSQETEIAQAKDSLEDNCNGIEGQVGNQENELKIDIPEDKKEELVNTDSIKDTIEKMTDTYKLDNDSVAELYGLTLEDSDSLELSFGNDHMTPISLFELTGEQWAKYINPMCKLAMSDTEQMTLTRIYKNDNKVVFLTMMELSKLNYMLDVDQGWNGATNFAYNLLRVNKYLLKFIAENGFELTEEEDKEYYRNICVNQFDYHNGVSAALAVTKDFDLLRIEFDMDFLEQEEVVEITRISMYLDAYFYDIARSLWRSVLDREAVINSSVPKYTKTNFEELILEDELWADRVLHIERN